MKKKKIKKILRKLRQQLAELKEPQMTFRHGQVSSWQDLARMVSNTYPTTEMVKAALKDKADKPTA